jgi:hypothetical protein
MVWPKVDRVWTEDLGSQRVEILEFGSSAIVFTCGAGDGNRTRIVSLGNLPPPVVRAPGTFCHVVPIDLC